MLVELTKRVTGFVDFVSETYGSLRVDNVRNLDVHLTTLNTEKLQMNEIKIGDRFEFEVVPDSRHAGWHKAIHVRRAKTDYRFK
jgi:hypothetical protein